MIPYGRQSIDEKDIAAVVEALRGDCITTGPWVERLEQAMAKTCGTSHAVAANANAYLYPGAEVVFADIDDQTGCLDPAKVEPLLDDSMRVVTCVDYAGHAPAGKAHEEMITASDARYTYDSGDFSAILPTSTEFNLRRFSASHPATPLLDGYSYQSGTQSDWPRINELRESIRVELNVDPQFTDPRSGHMCLMVER